ncbi:single-stranded DNA-binding protein [Deferribacter abyssi]|uniref:single-stranded DNA-binding protein n=1 Tax=Deferribacter abyssi TaxID=213806 RepID=UPI003C17DF5B
MRPLAGIGLPPSVGKKEEGGKTMYLNKVLIAGNLTKNPEIKNISKSKEAYYVAKFTVAINRKWKSKDGQTNEETTYVGVEAFGRLAEFVGEYFVKGMPIFVEGRLKLDRWEKDGIKNSKLKVIADSIQFASKKETSKGISETEEFESSDEFDEDDIPF